MIQYKKAVDYEMAMAKRCYWCIPREHNHFDCQFNQGMYFSFPCSQTDYQGCPWHDSGKRIRVERGF